MPRALPMPDAATPDAATPFATTPFAATPAPPHTTEFEMAAVTGAPAAFEQLYRETVDRVYGLSLRMTGDRRQAAELAQDVFVRAWRVRPWERAAEGGVEADVAARARALTWRWAVRRALAAARANPPRPASVRLVDGAGASGGSRSPGLTVALAALPAPARAAFVLHDVEGCPVAEVAEALGTDADEARARVAWARGLLAPSYPDPRELAAAARAARSAVTVPPDLWTVVAAATLYATQVQRHAERAPRPAVVAAGVMLVLAGATLMALLAG